MKKPANTGAALRTRTASWQYDSMDLAEGMDNNSNHPSYKELTKFKGNQHGGAAEGNFGRGATRGNTGATANQGKKQPPASAVPAFEKFKGPSDSINHGGQVRNAGGTRSWSPSGTQNYDGNIDKIDFGRGPTKGNGQ
mgnify:CR=1 FL=1